MPEPTYIIHTDGASRGNPGHAGIAYLIEDESGRILCADARYIGTQTNNVAEYRALIDALTKARSLGLSRIRVYSDSELMVKQLRGEYRVKNEALAALHAQARALLAEFDRATVEHVLRDKNRDADFLAGEAIRRHLEDAAAF